MNYRIIKIQKRILKDLNDSIHRVSPYSIAGIHVTILTILFAIVSTYTLIINERYKDLELKLFERAESINGLNFLFTRYFPKNNLYSIPRKGSDFSNNYSNYWTDIDILLSNVPHNSHLKLKSGDRIPGDPADRAELALGLINIVSHSYPFPKALERVSMGWSLPYRPETIRFLVISDIRKWLEDLREANQLFVPIKTFIRNFPKAPTNYFEALKEKNKDEPKKFNNLLPEAYGEKDPVIIIKNFLENLMKSEDIAESLKISFEKLDYLKTKIPSKFILIAGFGAIFIVFILGVIMPMLLNKVYKRFNIWIPTIFYVVAYFYIIYFTLMNVVQI